jgi:hypothetical protein
LSGKVYPITLCAPSSGARLLCAAPALAVARVFYEDAALGQHRPEAVRGRKVAGRSSRSPLVYELLQVRGERLYHDRGYTQDAVQVADESNCLPRVGSRESAGVDSPI